MKKGHTRVKIVNAYAPVLRFKPWYIGVRRLVALGLYQFNFRRGLLLARNWDDLEHQTVGRGKLGSRVAGPIEIHGMAHIHMSHAFLD